MSTEDQLRGAFARLVPDPPDIVVQPGVVEERGRKVRRRRAALSVVGVGVLAAVLVPAALTLGSDRPDTAPSDTNPTTATAPEPWQTNPCRGRYDLTGSTSTIPADLTSVRLCDLRSQEKFAVVRSPADALVTGLPQLMTSMESLPDADPSKCAAITPAPATAVIVFTGTDGSQTVVPAMACAVADLAGRQVEATGIHMALLNHLAQQRDELGYGLTEPSWSGYRCGAATAMLIHPDTESVVAAAVCTPTGQILVGPTGLTALSDAWSQATQSAPIPGCEEKPGHQFMLETSYGDLIRFVSDGCGGFVQTDAVTDDPWRIVIDYDTLTHIDS